MRTAVIALFTAAALCTPAMAQDQMKNNTNQDNPPAAQSEMNNQRPGSMQGAAGENEMGTQEQTGQMKLSSSEVKSIQEKLKSEGLHAGPADGKFGPETKSALEKFQKKNGLNATGEPDQKTLAALGINEQGGMQRSAKAAKPSNQEQQKQQENQNQPAEDSEPDQTK